MYKVGLFAYINKDFECKRLKFMTDFHPTPLRNSLGRWILLVESESHSIEAAENIILNNISNLCIEPNNIVYFVCKTSNRRIENDRPSFIVKNIYLTPHFPIHSPDTITLAITKNGVEIDIFDKLRSDNGITNN